MKRLWEWVRQTKWSTRALTFRVPWTRSHYLTIKLTGRWELPPDANRRVTEMVLGHRPADAYLMGQVWFRDQMRAHENAVKYNQHLRVLERKIQAQRAELNRLRPPRETAVEIHGNKS